MEQDKKYIGYGYHGGGRKKLNPDEKKVYKSISISGTPEQLELLKEKAAEKGMTVSKFVLEIALKN